VSRGRRVGHRGRDHAAHSPGDVQDDRAPDLVLEALAAVVDEGEEEPETERDRGLARAVDRVRGKYGPKSIIPGGLAPEPPRSNPTGDAEELTAK